MDGITELALLLKQRENGADYSPVFGRVLSLPELKIGIGNKITLTASQVVSCIPLRHDNEYSDVGKTVVLLPYADNQKYIMIGMVQ